MTRRGAKQGRGFDDAGADIIHRHRDANTAGGPDEGRALREGERLFREAHHFQRVLQTLLAGAGIGVAGVNYDCLSASSFHAFDADFNRRGAGLVSGEHAGHGAGRLRDNESKVALFPLVRAFAGAEAFDVAKDAGGAEALRRKDRTRDLG